MLRADKIEARKIAGDKLKSVMVLNRMGRSFHRSVLISLAAALTVLILIAAASLGGDEVLHRLRKFEDA